MTTFLLPLLAATFSAFGAKDNWHALQFRDIPPIKSSIGEKITLEVDGSAGGLVRSLSAGTRVKTLIVEGRVDGRLKVDAGKPWDEGHDDAYLRVGLIVSGGRPLDRLERIAAPAWVRRLDDVLCADGRAPSAIQSFNIVPHVSWIGKTRQNPKMKQLVEHYAAVPKADGSFAMRVDLPEPLDLVGLWLMADGDDSASRFTVTLDRLELVEL